MFLLKKGIGLWYGNGPKTEGRRWDVVFLLCAPGFDHVHSLEVKNWWWGGGRLFNLPQTHSAPSPWSPCTTLRLCFTSSRPRRQFVLLPDKIRSNWLLILIAVHLLHQVPHFLLLVPFTLGVHYHNRIEREKLKRRPKGC